MPIYEYLCKKCGEFEQMQRITDAPLARCPTCRGKVTKLISNTSFQLKGSGWYATDYARKDGKGKETSAETKTEAKSDSKTTTSDSKKTTTSETKAGSSKASSSKEAAAA